MDAIEKEKIEYALAEANGNIERLEAEVVEYEDKLGDAIQEKDKLEEENDSLREMLDEIIDLVKDTIRKYQAL